LKWYLKVDVLRFLLKKKILDDLFLFIFLMKSSNVRHPTVKSRMIGRELLKQQCCEDCNEAG
jgi:hypothetical protein